MRLASLLALLLLPAAALAQAPHRDPFANIKPATAAESAVLAQLKAGDGSLSPQSSLGDPGKQLSGKFVRSVMLLNASAVSTGSVSFSNFTIGRVDLLEDHPPVTLALDFSQCSFPDGIDLGGTFTHILNFNAPTFEGYLQMKSIRAQANILVVNPTFVQNANLILNDVQTTGDIYLRFASAQPANLNLASLKAAILTLIDTLPAGRRTQIKSSTFDSASIQLPSTSAAAEFSLTDSTVAHGLRISGAYKKVHLDNTTASGDTLLFSLPTDTLSLDSATFNHLTLRSDPVTVKNIFAPPTTTLRLPTTISLTGTTFSHIAFGVGKSKISTVQQTVSGIDFFRHAVFYQPALLKYQQQLQDEGNSGDAATMNSLIHQIMRSQSIHDSPWLLPRLKASVLYGLDFIQQWVFGYGTNILQPFTCSALFILLGTLLFFRKSVMEPIAPEGVNPPPNYSGFWYSLELFLPVVELGVAKFYRPCPDKNHRILYARIHQLAGWILIPVMVGVLTGSLK